LPSLPERVRAEQRRATLRGRLGPPIGKDLFWRAEKPLSAYATEAQALGRIAT
jgi:hypothetical protein